MSSQRYTLRSTHKMVRVRRLSSQVLALHRARRQVHAKSRRLRCAGGVDSSIGLITTV
jgi:hypothetical protein